MGSEAMVCAVSSLRRPFAAGLESLMAAVGIHKAIGKRPIAALGNSDGDFQMLEWTTRGPGARLGVLVHHDDAGREFAYDRKSPPSAGSTAASTRPARTAGR
jgi:hypothetical protein